MGSVLTHVAMLMMALVYIGYPEFNDGDIQAQHRLMYFWCIFIHSACIIIISMKKSFYFQLQKNFQVLVIAVTLGYAAYLLVCLQHILIQG